MAEYFMKDPYEIDREYLYPLLSVLTLGQIECVKNTGFKPLIAYAPISEADVEVPADSFREVLEKGHYGNIFRICRR